MSLDGVTWARLRSFIGGQQSDRARQRVSEGYVVGTLNFSPRALDGILVKRGGRSRANSVQWGPNPAQTFKITTVGEYTPADQTEPRLIAANADLWVGALKIATGGFEILHVAQIADIHQDFTQMESSLVVTSREEDPWLWNGGTIGGAILPHPSDVVYDASLPPCVVVLDRNDRGVASALPEEQPFNPGDVVWYLFALESEDGRVGPVSTDLPGCALRTNYLASKATKGYLHIRLPEIPASTAAVNSQNTRKCRIYRTFRQNVAGGIIPPRATADFHYVATSVMSGFYDDKSTDDQIAGNETPFGGTEMLPRAAWGKQHYGRLVLGDLRSPRTILYAANALLLSGDYPRLTMADSGTALSPKLLIKVDRNGGDAGPGPPVGWGSPIMIDVLRGEKAKDAVARFNQACDAMVALAANNGQIVGDPAAWTRLVLIGDGDVPIIHPLTANGFQSVDLEGAFANARIDTQTDAARRIIRHRVGAPSLVDRRNFIQIGDAVRPFRNRTDLRYRIGSGQGQNAQNAAHYRGPAGNTELLIGTRTALQRLIGQGVEIGGVPDFRLVDLSSELGFWCPYAVAESPEGVYFVSSRGCEYFDGARVEPIAVSDEVSGMLTYAIKNAPEQVAAQWWDSRLWIALPIDGGVTATSSRVLCYDERVAIKARDRSAGWSVHSGGIRSLGVWHRTIPFAAQLIGGTQEQANTDAGFVLTFETNPYCGDPTGGGGPLAYPSYVEFRTITPSQGKRIRARAVRPYYRGITGILSMSIGLDDRAYNDGAAAITLPSGPIETPVASLNQPLFMIGQDRNPRCRRMRIRIDANDLFTLEIHGLDIGFHEEAGSVVGAVR